MSPAPSRFARYLDQPASRKWLYLSIEGEPWRSQSDISEVTINRGGSDPISGVTPSTMEITVRGTVARQHGNRVRLFVSDLTAATMTATTSADPATIMDRFYGFVGIQEINDNGKYNTTTFKCSSVTAAVRSSRLKTQLTVGARVVDEIKRLFTDGKLLRTPAPVEYPGDVVWDEISSKSERDWRTYGETLDRLTTDAGVLLSHHRNGVLRPESLQSRMKALPNQAKWAYPLLRSQAIAPATWLQPADIVAKDIAVKRRGSDGAEYTSTLKAADSMLSYPEVEEYDMLHLVQKSDTYTRFARAKRNQVNGVSHALTGITVDLLALYRQARRGSAYARRVVIQMMQLEEGDPVFFTGDWPEPLRQPLMATGITEHISPDEWTLTITLDPPSHALGLFSSEITNAPARTWSSVLSRWNDTPGAWAEN